VAALLVTKGLVALCTVGYCQKRFGLLRWRPLLRMAGAVFLGGWLYVAGQWLPGRLAAEGLALLPLLALAMWWRKTEERIPA